jgi:hypothetical protein
MKLHVINNIRIYVYSGDHNPPHFHAFYAEYEVVIAIMSGEVIKGKMPKTQFQEVNDWLKGPNVRTNLVEAFHRLNPGLRRR